MGVSVYVGVSVCWCVYAGMSVLVCVCGCECVLVYVCGMLINVSFHYFCRRGTGAFTGTRKGSTSSDGCGSQPPTPSPFTGTPPPSTPTPRYSLRETEKRLRQQTVTKTEECKLLT